MKNNFLLMLFLLAFPACAGAENILKAGIEEISRLALRNNINIQIAGLRAEEAKCGYEKAQSLFDTFFTWQAEYERDRTLSNSKFGGTDTRSLGIEAGLKKRLPSGTQVGLNVSLQKSKTDSGFVSVPDARSAAAGVKLVQALGRDFFGLAGRGKVKMAFLEQEITRLGAADSIETALAEVQTAYWRLALSRAEEEIAREFVGTAKELLDIYRRKFKVGLVEEPDVFAALANLKEKKIKFLQAQARRRQAEVDLAYLLGGKKEGVRIVPQDSIDIAEAGKIEFLPELKKAVEKRRDYQAGRRLLEKENINLAVKKNALWPEIDLEASFSKNGISDKFRRSLREINSDNFSDFSVGIKVSFSWEKKKERAEYASARLAKARAILALKNIENLIFRQIYNQVLEVNTAAAAVEGRRRIVVWQKKKLEAEKNKLHYGRSSSDIVIRYENDLYRAKLELAEAFFAYRRSLIELERQENVLLAKYYGESL